jgi:hypothetical protein
MCHQSFHIPGLIPKAASCREVKLGAHAVIDIQAELLADGLAVAIS